MTWHNLDSIPDDRMDGRDVLLWIGRAVLAIWCDGWCDAVGRPVQGATHYADVGGPM